MPIDINELRDYKGGDPDKYRLYMEQRFKPAEWVDQVLVEDEAWRLKTQELDYLRRDVNKFQKEVITPKKKAKEDCTAEVTQLKEMQTRIKELEKELPLLAEKRDELLNKIANIVDSEVPISQDEEEDNLVVDLQPTPPDNPELPCPQGKLTYQLPPTAPLQHDDLLWRIGGYEPVRGQQVAGHRAYFLTNAGVLLNQAIINYSYCIPWKTRLSSIATTLHDEQGSHGIHCSTRRL